MPLHLHSLHQGKEVNGARAKAEAKAKAKAAVANNPPFYFT
jgi:hypothetical protein